MNIVLPFHTWRELLDNWGDRGFQFARDDAPRIVGILIVAFVLSRILKLFNNHLIAISKRQEFPSGLRAQQMRTVAGVIRGIGLFIIAFVAMAQILEIFHINIAPLLASAGVVGLAIGFGAQTLVKDVINGFFILIENQYDIGDLVKIGSVQGTVEIMTLRRTLLRDADGTVHNIPNSTIAVVSNMTRDWTQVTLHVSVDYKEDSDQIIGMLRQVADEIRNEEQFKDSIVTEPQVPGIDKINGSDVDYLIVVKTRPGQQWAVSREFRRKIKLCFEENGIKPGGQGPTYVFDSTMPSQAKR